MRKAKVYMAIDQHEKIYRGLVHPRKDLLKLLGRRHAEKMYVGMKEGSTYHIGYVIGELWLDVFQVLPFKGDTWH